MKPHYGFRLIWWLSNLLLAAALVTTVWSGIWELSVRRYLRGFSDAVVPEGSSPRERVEAILSWMQNGPPRQETNWHTKVSPHDPEDTLNYRQLLEVCGSATNAFLNLSRSAGVETRRLLLMTKDHNTKHVVAEVNLDGQWIIVDATYRVIMKDAKGNLLTRRDLQNPDLFREATSVLPNYPPEYTYDHFAHVRVAALPLQGARARALLDHLFPGWEELLDWSLLLERRSFLCFFLSVNSLVFFMLVRLLLGWIADRRLRIPRFHLRANLSRATAAFFTSPEIK
ncbi:MAG TPA: transglutaminase-like domain-containing protein [Candidatus Saccharimonadales bacterium]|nr:transglutaminase-like domain-containing protein [Candidatus Saccharimonadales bacterium]